MDARQGGGQSEDSSRGGAKPKRERKPPVDIRRTQIVERHKTIRLVAICALIAVCVWKISDAAVELLAKPPWVSVVAAIIAALGSGLIQVPILWRIRVRVRRFTSEVVSRNRTLEQLENPERSSSDLMPDGTDPPGDAPWDRPSS